MKTFQVHLEDYHGDNDFEEITAIDAEHAAELFAEKWDSDGDCLISCGHTIEVNVADENGENGKLFRVSGEMVASYWVRELES